MLFIGASLPEAERKALLSVVGQHAGPQVESDAPVLIERWQRGGKEQLHLLNYAQEPQTITVRFRQPQSGRILTPGQDEARFEGEAVPLELASYLVLLLD